MSNLQYIKNYFAHSQTDILCIQEHWLFKFQQSNLSNISDNTSFLATSVDEDDPLLPLSHPRGYGGVAIIWRSVLDRYIEPIASKSNRCIAITLTTNHEQYILINTYTPSSGHSIEEYQMVLDEVAAIFYRYQDSHKIMWLGDLNGSLVRSPTVILI